MGIYIIIYDHVLFPFIISVESSGILFHIPLPCNGFEFKGEKLVLCLEIDGLNHQDLLDIIE